jgi:hypothetical protein
MSLSLSLCMYSVIYIYIHTHTHMNVCVYIVGRGGMHSSLEGGHMLPSTLREASSMFRFPLLNLEHRLYLPVQKLKRNLIVRLALIHSESVIPTVINAW